MNIALKVDFLLADALTDILLLMKRIRHAERGRSLSFRTEEPTIYIAVAENNFFLWSLVYDLFSLDHGHMSCYLIFICFSISHIL